MINRYEDLRDYFTGGRKKMLGPVVGIEPGYQNTFANDVSKLLERLSGIYMRLFEKQPKLASGGQTQPRHTTTPTSTPTPSPVPTSTPTSTPTPTPTPTSLPSNIPDKPMSTGPTPTLVPDAENPYFDMLKNYFHPDDINRASNTIFGESSFDPMRVNINRLRETRRVSGPKELEKIIEDYGSTDVGLAQHNIGTDVGDALLDYMQSKNLTLANLLTPEINMQMMADRLYGKVPDILPGWGQWYTPYATEEVNY